MKRIHPISALLLGLSALCAHATVTFAPIDITTGTGTTATQSSLWQGTQFPGENALDGNFGNFTHTNTGDTAPTWEANFNRDESFNRIIITNRPNCCGDRLSDITVSVLDSIGTSIFTSPVLNPGNAMGFSAGANQPGLNVSLPALTTGRSIRITRDGASAVGGGNFLSLGEVQIGALADVILPAGTNLTQANIQGMTVAQSSQLGGFAPGLAVDNNFGNFTHTLNNNPNPTWQVDFGEEMLLESVSMFNRTSCCGGRLRDITVSVLDGVGGTVFTSTLLNPENILGFGGTNGGQIDLDFVALNGGSPITGQTVVITRLPDPDSSGTGPGDGASPDDSNVLSLGEVQVFGGSIPEPSSLALLGLAAAGLFVRRRR